MKDIGPTNVVIIGGGVAAAWYLGLFNQGKGDVNPDGLDIDSSKLTKPAASYESLADTIFNTMNSSPTFLDQTVGWENSTLLNQLKGLNPDELKQVYKDFGTRAETLPIPFLNNITIGEKHDLGWYLKKFMTSAGYSEMSKIWAGTGLVGDAGPATTGSDIVDQTLKDAGLM